MFKAGAEAAAGHRPLRGVLTTALAVLALTGCVVSETRPLPKLEAVQAKQQIPEAELLDVGIQAFDTNIPAALAGNEEALDKRRIYPDVRKAESRLLPARLKTTLEASGQWGAVRVVPEGVKFVDVMVSGKILESTGGRLELEIDAVDATGRVWIRDKTYSGDPDLGSYKTDAAMRVRDPFQNVYVQIANDLLLAREQLDGAARREVREVAQLRFAQDLDPRSFAGYLQKDANGITRLARLPAKDDPAIARIGKIRERDAVVIDTLDGYNEQFAEGLFDSYAGYRRTSREAIEKEDKARAQATARTVLGAAAVLASILAPSQCGSGDYNCQRIEDAVRYGGGAGGVAAVMSGIKKFGDAKNAAQEVKELARSFENEAGAQVVEVEGRSLKLTGTAEEQYREWRRLLAAIYAEETGAVASERKPTGP
ncbi:MAG: hypothetical protein KJS95_13490 [Gammaproteobacteria bacterium]|nr:hypothetical protein [Gammaproteobacteria bacterium]